MFRVRAAAAAMKISGEAITSLPAEWCSPIHASSKPSLSRCSINSKSLSSRIVGLTPAGWNGAMKMPKRMRAMKAPLSQVRPPSHARHGSPGGVRAERDAGRSVVVEEGGLGGGDGGEHRPGVAARGQVGERDDAEQVAVLDHGDT